MPWRAFPTRTISLFSFPFGSPRSHDQWRNVRRNIRFLVLSPTNCFFLSLVASLINCFLRGGFVDQLFLSVWLRWLIVVFLVISFTKCWLPGRFLPGNFANQLFSSRHWPVVVSLMTFSWKENRTSEVQQSPWVVSLALLLLLLHGRWCNRLKTREGGGGGGHTDHILVWFWARREGLASYDSPVFRPCENTDTHTHIDTPVYINKKWTQ